MAHFHKGAGGLWFIRHHILCSSHIFLQFLPTDYSLCRLPPRPFSALGQRAVFYCLKFPTLHVECFLIRVSSVLLSYFLTCCPTFVLLFGILSYIPTFLTFSLPFWQNWRIQSSIYVSTRKLEKWVLEKSWKWAFFLKFLLFLLLFYFFSLSYSIRTFFKLLLARLAWKILLSYFFFKKALDSGHPVYESTAANFW